MKQLPKVFVSLLIFLLSGRNAFAIYCTNCSTFYQQMFEYAEAVFQVPEGVLTRVAMRGSS